MRSEDPDEEAPDEDLPEEELEDEWEDDLPPGVDVFDLLGIDEMEYLSEALEGIPLPRRPPSRESFKALESTFTSLAALDCHPVSLYEEDLGDKYFYRATLRCELQDAIWISPSGAVEVFSNEDNGGNIEAIYYYLNWDMIARYHYKLSRVRPLIEDLEDELSSYTLEVTIEVLEQSEEKQ
ncbi:MAG: hypothetical protein F7C35_09080 [Desulfurococcales archaeon]|nr:hypothetical protein [Desulfurococcales archaeon]